MQSALRHMRVFHPGMPEAHALEIAERVSIREWKSATLGGAVGTVLTNYVRHRLTDYERLLRVPGMTRDEARMLVRQDVADVLAAWAMGPPLPLALGEAARRPAPQTIA